MEIQQNDQINYKTDFITAGSNIQEAGEPYRSIIKTIKEKTKEFSDEINIMQKTIENKTKFLDEMQNLLQGKRVQNLRFEKKLRIFKKPPFNSKAVFTNIKEKYKNDPDIIQALDVLNEKTSIGGQVLNIFAKTINNEKLLTNDIKNKLKSFDERQNTFVNSLIDEYNETTRPLRMAKIEKEKRDVQAVPENNKIRITKKSSEFSFIKPASSLLTGKSLWTLKSYLPADIRKIINGNDKKSKRGLKKKKDSILLNKPKTPRKPRQKAIETNEK